METQCTILYVYVQQAVIYVDRDLYMFLSNMLLEKCELLFDILVLAMEIYTICLRDKDNRVDTRLINRKG